MAKQAISGGSSKPAAKPVATPRVDTSTVTGIASASAPSSTNEGFTSVSGDF